MEHIPENNLQTSQHINAHRSQICIVDHAWNVAFLTCCSFVIEGGLEVVGEMAQRENAGGAARVIFGWPIAWLVVVVFEFACDGLVAEGTKRALRNACVLVIKLWQISVLVAVQPACMVPLSAWIAIFRWIRTNEIAILIRKPELTNGIARVDHVERKTAEQ